MLTAQQGARDTHELSVGDMERGPDINQARGGRSGSETGELDHRRAVSAQGACACHPLKVRLDTRKEVTPNAFPFKRQSLEMPAGFQFHALKFPGLRK